MLACGKEECPKLETACSFMTSQWPIYAKPIGVQPKNLAIRAARLSRLLATV
jgi:hypothetical protein